MCTLARLYGQEELPKGRIWNIPVSADGQDHLMDGGQEETVQIAEGDSRLTARGCTGDP